jgi:putative aldouronate transport system substrate-binding protein
MNAFIYTNSLNYFFIDSNHQLQYAPMQEAWRDGLRFMKQLYNEGLLDSAAFTQTMAQVKQLGTNPEKVVLGSVTTGHPGHFVNISDTDPRHLQYVAVPPLKGPGGVQYAVYFGGYISGSFVITDKCKNPAAAFRFGDFFYSELGTLVAAEGVEGVTWRKAEPGELNILGKPAEYTRISGYAHVQGQANNFSWGNSIFRNRGDEFTGLRGKFTYSQDPDTVDGYEVRLLNETKKYDGKEPQEKFTTVFLSPDIAEDCAQMKVNIEAYVNQSIVQFITGGLDIEQGWDAYITQLKNLEIDKYLKYFSDAYNARIALSSK